MSSENFNTSSVFSDDQIKDFFEKKFKEIQTQEPVGVKLVDKDEDGQSKYVFDKDVPNSIYNDRQLIDTARAFYYTRDGIDFKTDDAVVDKFISDRTWKQANTYSIGKELIYATSESISADQKRRLAYLTDYWGALPNFYEAGGRGYVDGLISNISKGLLDPTNLLGPGVAKATIGTAVTQAAKKGVDIATKKVLTKAIAYGTGAQFATDGVIGASVDAAIQATEKELQLRNTYDPKRMFMAATIQGGIGIFPGLPYTYGAAKTAIENKSIKNGLDYASRKVFDYAHPMKNLNEKLYGVKANIEGYKVKGKEIDKLLKDYVGDNPDNSLTKKINEYLKLDNDDLSGGAGLTLNKKELALLNKSKIRDVNPLEFRDPGDYGYVHLRELAASATKAESAVVENGVVVLPVTASRNALGKDLSIVAKGGYEKVDAKPLLKIYEKISEAKSVGDFNNYVQARRSLLLNKRGIATSMTKTDIRAAINKYKKSNYKNIYDEGLAELNKFSRAMLELHRRSGIISDEEFKLIINANPIYAPFYPKEIKTAIKDLQELEKTGTIVDTGDPKKVIGKTKTETKGSVKGPAKFEITGSRGDIMPLHEAFMSYTYHAYAAAEKNIAKLRVYDEIDDAITKGIFAKNEIIKPLQRVEFTDVIKKDLIKAIEKEAATRGIKFSKRLSSELFEGEDAIKVMSFKNNFQLKDGRIIDLVYKNGNLKAYEIIKPEFVDMFKSIGGITGTYLGKTGAFVDGLLRGGRTAKGLRKVGRRIATVSRAFPTLITHSPPFIAFNGIRDTLSGSVNSAFGFNALGFFPGLSTTTGFFKTFKPGKEILAELTGVVRPKHPNFLRLIKGMKSAFSASDYYRKMLNAGGGFASRKDTDSLIINLSRKIDEQNIPAKDKTVYKQSIKYLKDIGYLGLDFFKGYSQLVNRVEYASRLGEYQLAKKAGMSDRVASFAGREISTDFGMHGSSVWLNSYNRITMFFNAGLQGFYRGVLRRPTENPGKFAAGVIGSVVAPELLFWSLSNETPEYEELSEDIKLLHYTIPVYMEDQADGSHIRILPDGSRQRKIKHFLLIPKPYDLGAFANIARGIVEAVQEGSPDLVRQYFFASLAKVFPGLVKPTLASPLIDLALNKNYKGNQILPYYKTSGLFADQLVSTNTRLTSIKIANVINEMYKAGPTSTDQYDNKISPLMIDYLISNYFVGLAQFAPDIIDSKYMWDEKAYGPQPAKRVDENDIRGNIFSIVFRRFVSKTTPTKFSKNVSILYDLQKSAKKITLDASTASNDLVKIARDNGIDVERATREKVVNAEAALPLLNTTLEVIKDLRNQRNQLKFKRFDENGIQFTAETKLAAMEKLKIQENELAYNVLNDIISLKDPTFLVSAFGTKQYKEYIQKNIKTRPLQKAFAELQNKIFN
tara:strand:+ start:683 stop:4906 length:4224 start_codon:yes stop_codon:yes gene_type:complete